MIDPGIVLERYGNVSRDRHARWLKCAAAHAESGVRTSRRWWRRRRRRGWWGRNGSSASTTRNEERESGQYNPRTDFGHQLPPRWLRGEVRCLKLTGGIQSSECCSPRANCLWPTLHRWLLRRRRQFAVEAEINGKLAVVIRVIGCCQRHYRCACHLLPAKERQRLSELGVVDHGE